jgi:predicted lipoprotein with Yx(FWY)xxD motif
MAPGPVMHPATAGPTSAPQAGAPLQTAQLDGSAAYVTASNMPVYEFSGDMTDMSNCTGGCLSVWPRSTCAGRDPPGRMDVVHAARHAHRAAGVQRLTAVHV